MVSEKSLGFSFGKFGLERKVSVSDSENLVKKVSVLILEILVSVKKVSVSKNLVSIFFGGGFRKLGLGNKKSK